MRYAKDKFEAEDYLQEGFIKVFKNLKYLEKPDQLEGWMRTIMINTALERIRKEKHHDNNVELGDNTDLEVSDDAIEHLNQEALLKIIQSLPSGFRTVFNMYAIEGYSHKEIGSMLGITEGTSKSQFARARKLLQEKVNQLDQAAIKHLA
jgi:RNA polymerase sigma-70 factor (ECF subfamily)